MGLNTKKNLKEKAFKRDGWQDTQGYWYAMCAFGCGDILVSRTATLDRYPVMGQHGGTYTLSNIRLACRDCNSANINKVELAEHRREKARQKAARKKARPKTIKPPTEEDLRRQRRHEADQESDRIWNKEKMSFGSPAYSKEVKAKLKENYPTSEGRDVNGLRWD